MTIRHYDTEEEFEPIRHYDTEEEFEHMEDLNMEHCDLRERVKELERELKQARESLLVFEKENGDLLFG